MTPDKLRRACEVAGLRVRNGGPDGRPLVETPLAWVYADEADAGGDMLRAYVAARLVAMVRERTHVMYINVGSPAVDRTSVSIQTDPAAPAWKTLTRKEGEDTMGTIILAALAALGEG